MKRILVILSGMLTGCLLTVSMGWCHGVEGYVEQIKAHCITAMYDDGEPMSYSEVEIKDPGSEVAFQTGRTDANGCFMVKAVKAGTWTAVINDGMGHRLALDFTVKAEMVNSGKVEKPGVPTDSRQMSRLPKVIAGLSVIIGLAGFFYGWKARRTEKNNNGTLSKNKHA
jgi:hypothetical protein